MRKKIKHYYILLIVITIGTIGFQYSFLLQDQNIIQTSLDNFNEDIKVNEEFYQEKEPQEESQEDPANIDLFKDITEDNEAIEENSSNDINANNDLPNERKILEPEDIAFNSDYPLIKIDPVKYSRNDLFEAYKGTANKERIKILNIARKLSLSTYKNLYKVVSDGITRKEENYILLTLQDQLDTEDYQFVYGIYLKYKR